MKKMELATYICLGVAFASLMPLELLAKTADAGTFKDAANAISDHADDIQSFLFGSPIRYVGVLGFGYGLIQGVLHNSWATVASYGALCITTIMAPSVIDGIFSTSGMLIP